MTSLHVNRRTCSVFGGLGKLVDIFLMKTNFLLLIEQYFENIRHFEALSTNMVKLNSTGQHKICQNVDLILLTLIQYLVF